MLVDQEKQSSFNVKAACYQEKMHQFDHLLAGNGSQLWPALIF